MKNLCSLVSHKVQYYLSGTFFGYEILRYEYEY